MSRRKILYSCVLCSWLVVKPLLAGELSVTHFEKLETQVSLSLKDLTGRESISELNGRLSNFKLDQQIIARHYIINLLAGNLPSSQAHREWVNEQTKDANVLYTRYPEHPEQKIELVNIARTAEKALVLWEIAEFRQQFTIQWDSQSWQWPTDLTPEAKQGLINWLATLSTVETDILVADFLLYSPKNLVTDNQFLYAMAKQSGSVAIYKRLWQQNADQFTYKALAELPMVLEEKQGIEQIAELSQKPQLASQALLSLARHYSHHKEAQALLTKALDSTALGWHAASALKYIKNPAFKAEMQKRLANKDDKVSRFANKNLTQGAKQ